MNWEKIKSKKKIWNLILKFLKEKRKLNPNYINVQDNHIGYLETDSVHGVFSFIPIDDRFLFDFFDEQEIYLSIQLDRTMEIKYSPFVLYTSTPITTEDYYRNEPSNEWQDEFLYKIRKEAEEAAWLKAFEILENY